jgi:hypothetical protein
MDIAGAGARPAAIGLEKAALDASNSPAITGKDSSFAILPDGSAAIEHPVFGQEDTTSK